MRRGVILLAAGLLVSPAVPARAQSDAAQGAADSGRQLYMQGGCFTCHGEMGFGGAGPRLRNDPLLVLDDYVAGQILVGRGIMPSFARLSNAQVAQISSYIRNSWGNHYGDVSAQQVQAVRETFKRQFPNTPLQDLQRLGPDRNGSKP